MKDYFDAEMRLLNDKATEFAKSYPEQASMLNLTEIRDRDPYIERLLEGMAYLTANIRRQIDDDIPELSQTLLQQMWPQFIRPFPSSTIIQFSAKQNILSTPEICKKGTRVLSDLVGETGDEDRKIKGEMVRCEYRTTNEIIINPIFLENVDVVEDISGSSTIRLHFEISAGADPKNLDLSKMQIYLHGYPTLTLDLWFYLTQCLTSAYLKYNDGSRDHAITLHGQECITPANMDLESTILPKSGRSFVGSHLLHEYFCFREKFHFIDIHGLGDINWPVELKVFILELNIDGQLPADYRIDNENFRLHCTPAVNLFKSESEPVLIDHKRSEYRVQPNVEQPTSKYIYGLDSVESICRTSGQRHIYHSIHRLKHSPETPRFYHVNFSRRPDGGEEALISLGGISKYEPETLSCSIQAYNGHFPRRYLIERSIKNNSSNNNDLSDSITLMNITRPTPTYMPPKEIDYQWGLVAHLSLNYSSIAELETLKKVLTLYEWTGRNDNQRKIDGIKDVNMELYQEMYRGALMRGIEIVLTLHEGSYASLADISLFGQVLHNFFTLYANVNTLVQTKILCHPSGKELSWQPAPGETSLM